MSVTTPTRSQSTTRWWDTTWRKSCEEKDHCHRSWVSLLHLEQGARKSWTKLWSTFCRSGSTQFPLSVSKFVTNMSWFVWSPTILCLFFIIIFLSLSDLCQPGLSHSFNTKLCSRAKGESTQTHEDIWHCGEKDSGQHIFFLLVFQNICTLKRHTPLFKFFN